MTVAQLAGITRLDLPLLLGTIATEDPDRARVAYPATRRCSASNGSPPDHDIDQLAPGNGDLDSWRRGAALIADRAGTARIRVWLDDAAVVGYFAIVPHTVRRAELPPAVGRGAA